MFVTDNITINGIGIRYTVLMIIYLTINFDGGSHMCVSSPMALSSLVTNLIRLPFKIVNIPPTADFHIAIIILRIPLRMVHILLSTLLISPFLTISLCRAGHYFDIQYFRSCAMSSVSWYFFMSPCMLSQYLFSGRPLLFLPENYSLSDFAQMCLCSRLKQWPNHFSVLFSPKFSTGFM